MAHNYRYDGYSAKPASVKMREWLKTPSGMAYKERQKLKLRQDHILSPGHATERQRQSVKKIRLEVMEHYCKGPAHCMCCGESMYEFLTMDHVNGDGSKHRKEILSINGTRNGASGTSLLHWLKRNEFPEGFQVLCANCNFAKRTGRFCPHQKARDES